MSLFTGPSQLPSWMWAFAVVWSLYQAYVGYVYGLFIHRNAGSNVTTNAFVKHSAYGLHHAALYFASSLFGVLALQVLLTVAGRIDTWSAIGAGTGTLLVGLAILSIAGVSGTLAGLLYRGAKLV